MDSPIDVVTVDLSPIGGNASTVMFNIGNYTEDDISWTMYNYTTNASIEGTFNLMVNATNINGNYNDTANITLEVKKIIKIEIAFSGDMVISNITFDALIPSPKGIEKHRRSSCVVEFGNVWKSGVCDKQTNWCINVRGERCSVRSIRIKQLVTWRKGVEVANLTFDPPGVCDVSVIWNNRDDNQCNRHVSHKNGRSEQRYEKIGSNLAIAKQLK